MRKKHLQIPTVVVAPPAADYTVTNYTELNTLIGPASATNLTGKTVAVTGDCIGAEIDLSNRTWPGLTITGTSVAIRPRMPRLKFGNTNGAVGSPITFKWLDFYNVATVSVGSVGQMTFYDTFGPSSYIDVTECKLHDDPFPTKSFKGGAVLAMYWGFGYSGNGMCHHMNVSGCEIYNQVRSIFKGDYVNTWNNNWHDHYNHAATVTGNHQHHYASDCFDLWAADTDTGTPHAGIAFSPSPPTIPGDVTDIVIEGITAGIGVARKNYDGAQPPGTGIKFNDMFATGFHYKNCVVRGCLLIGSSSIMIEMDNGQDCIVEGNTLVYDEAYPTGSALVYVNNEINCIVRNNIFSTIGIGAQGRGDAKVFNNGRVTSLQSGADNLLAYANAFVGPTFSSLIDPPTARAAFTLNPTHPMASWSHVPGAMANYDFDTSTYIGVQQAAPVSSNVTSRTTQTRTKGNDVYLRTALAGLGVAAWQPTNLRKLTLLANVSNDATIDAANGYLMYVSSNNRAFLWRKSTGVWNLVLKDSAGATLLDAVSNTVTTSASGLKAILVTVDLDQAKVNFAFSDASGYPLMDCPTINTMRRADIDPVGRRLSIGMDNLSTLPGNTWVGQMDCVLMEDQFVDLGTDAGVSAFFNTSGGLVSLGATGGNPFGSTPAIFLSGTAADWNSASFNLGDGVGSTGTPTKLVKNGTGSFS